MSRENCFEVYMVKGKSYCNYFDWGCMLCSEVKKCPEGLDDDYGDNSLDYEDICIACNGSGEDEDAPLEDGYSPACRLCRGSGIFKENSDE